MTARGRRRDGAGWTIERVFDLFPFPGLRQLPSRNGGFLSGGQQQMLTAGRNLMGNPKPLLLDEPSGGPRADRRGAPRAPQARRTDDPARRAERELLARAGRPRLLAGEGHIRYEGTAAALRADETLRHRVAGAIGPAQLCGHRAVRLLAGLLRTRMEILRKITSRKSYIPLPKKSLTGTLLPD